ncbi:MAG TPA: signal peptidase I [Gemmataceae bacterium]|jgi:signal peptidase I|nr:signal peptidase I [Gemmataceae bacterium]
MTAILVVNFAMAFLAGSLPDLLNPGDESLAQFVSFAALAGQAAIACLLIRTMLGTTFRRAFLAFLVALIPSVFMVLFVFLVFLPYVAEGFVVPNNSMAPTIVGWHRESICPRCGGVLIVPASAPEEESQRPADEIEPVGICVRCQKSGKAQLVQLAVCKPDRIMVNKLQSPGRWDLVAFRSPERPGFKYIQRLVGLPGEEVFLEEGAIWINEVKINPPAEIAPLEFVTVVSHGMPINIGTRAEPMRLKENECCLLGDFSMESLDSRFRGPVPVSNIEGVVGLRYWPLSRLHVWR